jgi:multiple sugar transport system substrate-binding protein
VALLAVFLAAACGSTTAEPYPLPQAPTPTAGPTRTSQAARTPTPVASATPVPPPTLAVSESALRGATVEFWHIHGFLLPSMQGEDTLQSLADEFNRTNTWGISVNTTTFNDYEEIITTIQSSIYGDLPDLFLGYNYQAASLYRSGDLLADLSPYLNDARWGLTPEEIADFLPVFWHQEQEEGARLGLPFYRSGQVLLYNQSWAEELGFDEAPATPDEFVDQACAAAAAFSAQGGLPARAGGLAIDATAPTLAAWIYAFGGALDRPGESGYTFDDPPILEAFTFLRKLHDDGCAWFPGSPYPNQEFASRQALFVSGSVAGLHHQETAFETAGSSDRWAVIPYPSEAGLPVMVVYGPSLFVLRGEIEQELATWLFARWLASPEVQAGWVRDHGTLPTRNSVMEVLSDYRSDHPNGRPRLTCCRMPGSSRAGLRGAWCTLCSATRAATCSRPWSLPARSPRSSRC